MYLAYHSCPMTLLLSKKLGILVETSRQFSRKQREGFFVQKNACIGLTTAPTPLKSTAPSTPQHQVRHSTYIAHIHISTYIAPRTAQHLHRPHTTRTQENLRRLYCTLSYFLARGGFGGSRRDAPLCGDRACRNALSEAPREFSSSPASPLADFSVWERWCVERPENSVWNRRPCRCFSAGGSTPLAP